MGWFGGLTADAGLGGASIYREHMSSLWEGARLTPSLGWGIQAQPGLLPVPLAHFLCCSAGSCACPAPSGPGLPQPPHPLPSRHLGQCVVQHKLAVSCRPREAGQSSRAHSCGEMGSARHISSQPEDTVGPFSPEVGLRVTQLLNGPVPRIPKPPPGPWDSVRGRRRGSSPARGARRPRLQAGSSSLRLCDFGQTPFPLWSRCFFTRTGWTPCWPKAAQWTQSGDLPQPSAARAVPSLPWTGGGLSPLASIKLRGDDTTG